MPLQEQAMDAAVSQQTGSKSSNRQRRQPFERIALVLQGGGALGAYQGGVYQALSEANLHPDWVSGISIGALDTVRTLRHPEVLERPRSLDGVFTFDLARDGRF